MKWVIGLDLRPRSDGALQLAKWLAEATRPHAPDAFTAVHVLDVAHLDIQAALRYDQLDDIHLAKRAAAQSQIESASSAEVVRDVEVTRAVTVDEGLEQACARHGAHALIIGRAAPTHGMHLVRLGSVARRVLRRLPAPVAVVPPDFAAAKVGDGPIVALSRLADDSVEACREAAALASRTGRSVAVVHVVPDPRADLAESLPTSSLEPLAADVRSRGEAALHEWLAAHGLQPAISAVLQGDVFRSALAFVERCRAPLVVLGARQLAGLDRLFAPSLGRDLAANAALPVLIVPPRSRATA